MVNGHDVVRDPMAVRRMIGLAGQSAAVEEMMTGRENLVMVARLYGQGRKEAVASASAILEQMDLVEAADRQVRTYSGGMRRRLDLGASLVGSPRLLLLDEPTTGLDPGSRNEVWDAVHAMSEGGTDIVLTTQYLDEADHLATAIVIIDEGRVIAQGTPDELKSRVGADMVELHTIDVADHAARRRGAGVARHGRAVDRPGHAPVLARRAGRLEVVAGRGAALDDAEVPVEDIALRRPTLDEVFLALTGRRLDDAAAPRPTRPEGGRSMTITLDQPGRPTRCRPGRRTNQGASFLVATEQVAARTLKKFIRSPALLIAGTRGTALPAHLPLRLRRGGRHTGGLSYVDFLVPGFVVTGVLFQGMSAASGVADDGRRAVRPVAQPADPAAVDRLGPGGRRHGAGGLGRDRHDGGGVRRRLPRHGDHAGAVAAFGLTILYGFAFVWLFIALGLMAGSPPAAQGLSFLVFPLSFVSSAYVPVSTMPGWMQAFANNQPMTQMVNTVRLLTGGPGRRRCSATRCRTTWCPRCSGRPDSSSCSRPSPCGS